MPKSKISSDDSVLPAASATGQQRMPVKLNPTGTSRWYIAIMLAFMLVGLAWLVVNYLAGPSIGFMVALGAWNYLIGFSLLIIGLLMTMGWK